MNLNTLSEFLASYSGRDKVLRLLSYAGKLSSGLSNSADVAGRSQIFSSQISGCRVILRLLDDIPMLNSVLGYGLGKQESDWILRCATLLQNCIDVTFYPIEHICWAGSKQILPIKNVSSLETLTTWCWILSLYLSLVKCSRRINQLQKHTTCLQNSKCDVGVARHVLVIQKRDELWTCLRLILDLSYAVNYLPPGTLWGGRLKTWHVGALGTISSVIVLYQGISKHISSKK